MSLFRIQQVDTASNLFVLGRWRRRRRQRRRWWWRWWLWHYDETNNQKRWKTGTYEREKKLVSWRYSLRIAMMMIIIIMAIDERKIEKNDWKGKKIRILLLWLQLLFYGYSIQVCVSQWFEFWFRSLVVKGKEIKMKSKWRRWLWRWGRGQKKKKSDQSNHSITI